MWSLGVLAFILLSGTYPFSGKSVDETYLNITEGKGVSFNGLVWKHVSHYAKNWIGKLVIKDSSKRMTVTEALADPWLNGEAEAKISKTILSTECHKNLIEKQTWRKIYKDILPVGSLSHEGAVYLKLSQEGIAMERELFMELPDKVPEVVIELSNNEAYEGTVGRFKCKFHSQPEATVKWFHEEYALDADNPKYNMWYKHGLAMLNICDVDMEDSGQYSCVATNRLGSCTTVGELNIQEQAFKRSGYIPKRRRSVSFERDSSLSDLRRSHSTERQASLDRSLGSSSVGGMGSAIESFSSGYGSSSAKVAPQFVLPLLDQAVVVGQPCTLTVLMSCKPDIEVTWFHGQTKLISSSQYHMDSDNSNTFSLTIASVTADDAGTWRCLGGNSYGQCMCVCKLQVLDEVPANCEGPNFTQPLVKTIVVEGGSTRLECKVNGIPQPEVQWFKDRKLIGDDPFYMISCEENEVQTLYIPATYAEHAGWYTCQARNVAGSVHSEARLVVERIDCESMFSTHSSFDRTSLTDDLDSIHTRTTTGSAQRRKKLLTSPPQFTARLRPKRCMEGQSVRFNCSVSGIPDPSISWQRANGTVVLPSSRIKISNNYGLCSLEITRVRRDDAGMYIVTASNTEGEVTSTATLDVEALLIGKSLKGNKSHSFDSDWLRSASEDEDISSLGLSPYSNQHTSIKSPSIDDHHSGKELPEDQNSCKQELNIKSQDPQTEITSQADTHTEATILSTRAADSKPEIASQKTSSAADITEAFNPTAYEPDIAWADDFESAEEDQEQDIIQTVTKKGDESIDQVVHGNQAVGTTTGGLTAPTGGQGILWADDSDNGPTDGSDIDVLLSDDDTVRVKQCAVSNIVSAGEKGNAVEDKLGEHEHASSNFKETDHDSSNYRAGARKVSEVERTESSVTDRSFRAKSAEDDVGLVGGETGSSRQDMSTEIKAADAVDEAANVAVRNILQHIESRAEEDISAAEQLISRVAAKVEDSLTNVESDITDEGGSAPLIQRPLVDVTVRLGATATFTCVIDSNAKCTVVWLKDGRFAKSRQNVQLIEEGNGRHTLVVSAVSEDDAGEYTLDAMNKYGSVSSTATLTITEPDKEDSRKHSVTSDQPGKKTEEHTKEYSSGRTEMPSQHQQQQPGQQQQRQPNGRQHQQPTEIQQQPHELQQQSHGSQQQQQLPQGLREQDDKQSGPVQQVLSIINSQSQQNLHVFQYFKSCNQQHYKPGLVKVYETQTYYDDAPVISNHTQVLALTIWPKAFHLKNDDSKYHFADLNDKAVVLELADELYRPAMKRTLRNFSTQDQIHSFQEILLPWDYSTLVQNYETVIDRNKNSICVKQIYEDLRKIFESGDNNVEMQQKTELGLNKSDLSWSKPVLDARIQKDLRPRIRG